MDTLQSVKDSLADDLADATHGGLAAGLARIGAASPFTTKARAKALRSAPRCDLDLEHFCYQSCRFCQRSVIHVKRLWKYGVRHYACDACKAAILRRSSEHESPALRDEAGR